MTAHDICAEAEIPEGAGACFSAGGRRLALFRAAGKLYAMDDTCPHAGGPLSEGAVEEGLVTCPWHGWQFRSDDGSNPRIPASKVRVYPVKTEDGRVFVDLA